MCMQRLNNAKYLYSHNLYNVDQVMPALVYFLMHILCFKYCVISHQGVDA